MKKNPLFKAETTLKFGFSNQSIIAKKKKAKPQNCCQKTGRH
jgi:hypothetical protein